MDGQHYASVALEIHPPTDLLMCDVVKAWVDVLQKSPQIF